MGVDDVAKVGEQVQAPEHQLHVEFAGSERPNELILYRADFKQDWDEGSMIEQLRILNPKVAVHLACFFFGLVPKDAGFTVIVSQEEEEEIQQLFEEYCTDFAYTIGRRVFASASHLDD